MDTARFAGLSNRALKGSGMGHFFSNRIIAATILGLPFLLWLVMIGAGFFHHQDLRQAYRSASRDREALVRWIHTIDRIREAQVHFKIQVQEWKNALLRGEHDPAAHRRYLERFEAEAGHVKILLTEVAQLLKGELGADDPLLSDLDTLLRQHQELLLKYRRGQTLYDPEDHETIHDIDRSVYGIDRLPTARMDQLVVTVTERVNQQLKTAAFREESAFMEQQTFRALILILLGMIIFPVSILGVVRYLKYVTDRETAAQQASQGKSLFLATMSHEIRTPLNSILGMLELLRQAPLAERNREQVEIAYGSGKSLLSIIGNILDYSKIEAGQLLLESTVFNLRDLLEETVQGMTPLALERGVALNAFYPMVLPNTMVGDGNRLRQIFTNLIGNAIKFTPAGGTVDVLGAPVAREEGCLEVMFEVRDSGIGIPETMRERVFERFSQADQSTTRTFGGTGLGLSICRHLVTLMGGEIGVDDNHEAESGTIFHFTIRLEEQARSIDVADSPRPDLRDKRILLVSCRGLLSAMLCDALMTWGGTCRKARELDVARKMLRQAAGQEDPFELMIIDQSQGERAPPLLREFPGLRYILLTDFLDQGLDMVSELPKEALCLKKPVTVQRLQTAIEQLEKQDSPPESTPDDRPEAEPGERRSWKTAKILVVDDQVTNLKVTVSMLVSLGCQTHNCETAVNGREAVERFRNGRFGLVLMDCQMPVMDGFDATRAIRELEKDRQSRPVTIVALTADVTKECRISGKEAGMDDFVSKPVSLDTLKVTLMHHLPQDSVDGNTDQQQRELRENMLSTLHVVGLREQDLDEIAQMIVLQFPELLNNLERDLATGELEVVRAASHIVKGSMVNTLFPDLRKETRSLHEKVVENDRDGAMVHIGRIRKQFDLIQKVLNTFIKEP